MDHSCKRCGAPASPDGPQPSSCRSCPPRECDSCGLLDHISNPCPCWLPASDHIADIKAAFTAAGADIEVRGE